MGRALRSEHTGPRPDNLTHVEVANFHFACGFSGHGLMQTPAIGRALSELLTYQEFRTLDLSPLSYARIASGIPFRGRVRL